MTTMSALLRQLRGLIGISLAWGVLWALVIMAIGAVIQIVDPDSIDPGEGLLVAAGIIGFQGLVAGAGFGLFLALTETRKRILNLSLIRVATWGFLASAALPFVTGMPVGMVWFVCLLGTGSATASIAIAQSAERRNPAAADLPGSASLPT